MAASLGLITPELVVLAFAVALLLIDLASPRKELLVSLALLGLLISANLTITMAGSNPGAAFGGMLVIDDFSIVLKVLMLFSTAIVVLASTSYARHFERFQGEYYSLLLFACAGMMFMASAAEFITIYLSLELTGIALAILAGMMKNRTSSEAGIKYLLLGALSSAVLLYGIVLFFGLTGSTYLTQIQPVLLQSYQENHLPITVATVLLIAGFGFKLATVPFQMWVPDVYEGAPTPVTAFLSVASKAAGIAVILRIFHTALGDGPLPSDWTIVFAVLSAFSMTIGNVIAIQQTNIKRMMGYSSIAQAGYLLVGMAVLPTLGPGGVLFFLVSYTVTNLGAFLAIIALSEQLGSDLIDDYAGAWQRAPWLAFALAFCLLSLTGLPPTAGFFAKLFIFNAGVQQGLAWLVLVGVVNTAISAYYYVGVIKTMFLRSPASESAIRVPIPLGIALLIATVGTFLLGVLPGPTFSIAMAAAGTLVP